MKKTETANAKARLLEASLSPSQYYWHRIRTTAAELDPAAAARDQEIRQRTGNRYYSGNLEASTEPVWITSEELPKQRINGGRIFCVRPFLAAKCIVEGTHSLASKKQIRIEQRLQKSRQEKPAPARPGYIRERLAAPLLASRTPRQELIDWFRAGVALTHKFWGPALDRLRLRFYRPTPNNDDWLLSPEKRAKVSRHIAKVLSQQTPSLWARIFGHWKYALAGAGSVLAVEVIVWLVRS